ncbi:MAG: cell wall hydrolase, partial [Sulfitobacter sp.]|nr:cell wall hydrolase [Sulfitobacter sp.]
MRSFQKISSCALLALSLLAPAVASASPQQAKALADIEAKGLRSVGSERLESMIASNNASEVEFTRAWLAEQPKASGGEQWRCLAEALYFEARGETVKGQFAVAEVIM